MKRVIFLVFLFLNTVSWSQAQGFGGVGGAAPESMSIKGLAVSTAFSGFINPATLAYFSKPTAGLYYASGLVSTNLSTKAATAVLPGLRGVFALSGSYYGYSQYSEQRYSLAYAKVLGSSLSAGVSLDYCHLGLGGAYGSSGAFTFGLGVKAQLATDLQLGARVFNPISSGFSNLVQANIPSEMGVGLSYSFSKQLWASLEILKQSDRDASIGLGFEYAVLQNFKVRGGYGLNPNAWSFGVGFKTKYFDADLTSVYHPIMGFAPRMSVVFWY
jgi:hypothetical protein